MNKEVQILRKIKRNMRNQKRKQMGTSVDWKWPGNKLVSLKICQEKFF